MEFGTTTPLRWAACPKAGLVFGSYLFRKTNPVAGLKIFGCSDVGSNRASDLARPAYRCSGLYPSGYFALAFCELLASKQSAGITAAASLHAMRRTKTFLPLSRADLKVLGIYLP